jgi:hypothetical protein
MNNRRTLVLTGATDVGRIPSTTDNTYCEVLELTLPSKQRYALKHGYDFMVLRSFGSDKRNKLQRTDYNVGFLRVLRALEMLEYYDSVMWIEGDSLITNDNYTIEDFSIDDEYTLYASWDWMHKNQYTNGSYSHAFSMGNFILHNSKHIGVFTNMFFNAASKHFSEEQFTLNALYAQTPIQNTIKILDHRFLGGVPKQIEDIWENRKLIDPWTEDFFLAHFTGISNKNRIDMMKNYFGKYL